MSKSQVVHPILHCLQLAEQFLGKNRTWQANNSFQQTFLESNFRHMEDVEHLTDILKGIASKNVAEVNAFLKQKGFDIQLQDTGQGSFAMASVLDVLIEWTKEGEEGKIRREGFEYPAFFLNKDIVTIWHIREGTVAEITTKGGDIAYVMVPVSRPDEMRLIQIALDAQEAVRTIPVSEHLEGIVLPMVDMDHCVDISWIVGMSTISAKKEQYYISQALQQTKLRMNQTGARAQSAAAMEMRYLSAPRKQPWIVNEPFLFWISRDIVKLPVFATYVTPEDWKRPTSLD